MADTKENDFKEETPEIKFEKLEEDADKYEQQNNTPAFEENIEYREDPYRFVILFLFVLSIFGIFPLITSFLPIVKTLKFLYNISEFDLYFINNLFTLGDLLFSMPAMYIIGKIGLWKAMSLGLLLVVIGSIIRLFLTIYFPLIYIGNLFISMGMQLITTNILKITTLWFFEKKRPMVFGFLAVMNSLGTIFGFFLPMLLVDEDFSSREKKANQIQNMLYVLLSVNLTIFIVFTIFFKEKPKFITGPESKAESEPFLPSIKQLFFNRNYIFYSVGFSYLASSFLIFNLYSHYVYTPFGFTQQNISQISIVSGLASIIGKLASGYFTTKVENKQRLLLWICFGIIVSIMLFLGCLFSYNLGVSYAGAFILGIFIHSFWPVCNMLLIKISQPISDVYSFGFGQILVSVQIIINGLIFARVYQETQSVWTPFTFSYMVIAYSISLLCFYLVKLKDDQLTENKNGNLEKAETEKVGD